MGNFATNLPEFRVRVPPKRCLSSMVENRAGFWRKRRNHHELLKKIYQSPRQKFSRAESTTNVCIKRHQYATCTCINPAHLSGGKSYVSSQRFIGSDCLHINTENEVRMNKCPEFCEFYHTTLVSRTCMLFFLCEKSISHPTIPAC